MKHYSRQGLARYDQRVAAARATRVPDATELRLRSELADRERRDDAAWRAAITRELPLDDGEIETQAAA